MDVLHKSPKSAHSIECFLSCRQAISCIGASFDNKGVCLNHKTCTSVSPCADDGHDPFYLLERCVNGGEWDADTSQCKCVDGWIGSPCNERPQHCDGLAANGYPLGKRYRTVLDLDKDGKNLVPVVCWLSGSAPTVQILKNTGSNEYNKTWAQYRDGFYNEDTKIWLTGLKSLHLLTEAGYRKLRLNIGIPGLGGFVAYYNGFRVSDEASGFSFTFDNYSPEAKNGQQIGDCLGPYQNTPFSTWDQESDGVENENCASRAGAGWWYDGDGDNPCNFFGLHVTFLDSKPSYQVISILGFDMNDFKTGKVEAVLHLLRN